MSENFSFYSDVKETKVDWLWYPYIPYGKLTILQGDPGEGKSSFIINVIANLTTGNDFIDGQKVRKKCVVVYQNNEDDAADTIKPRLLLAGADCSKVAFINEKDAPLSTDDKRIEETINKTKAKLFVLDPMQSYFDSDLDIKNIVSIRHVMNKLSDIAKRTGCAILLIGHMNKNEGSKSLYRGFGSIDIAASARSVLMIERDEDNPTIRYMFSVKSNLAPKGDAISFRFLDNGKLEWIGKALSPANDFYYKDKKIVQAMKLLEEVLTEDKKPSIDVIMLMESKGISQRTLYDAKKRTGVKSLRENGQWFWYIPEAIDEV